MPNVVVFLKVFYDRAIMARYRFHEVQRGRLLLW